MKKKDISNKIAILQSVIDDYRGMNQSIIRQLDMMGNNIEKLKKDIHELKQEKIKAMPDGPSKAFANKFGVE